MSALFLAVPLSVMIGALAIIRRGRADCQRTTPAAVRRTPQNNLRHQARQRTDLARRRSQL